MLGENGAGKSTLMKLLSGDLRPDSGEVFASSQKVTLDSPLTARSLGIGIVQQHFMLVPALTVAENLALDRLGTPFRTYSSADLSQAAQAWAERLGWELPLPDVTETLPVGIQQRIEILKVLSGGGDVIILDEPTAVLSPDEVEDLFSVLRQLRDEGRTVILIAHKLAEVTSVADRVTILRRGEWVASCPMSETSAEQIARWMIGELPTVAARVPRKHGGEVATLRALTTLGDRGEVAVRGIDLSVARGEVVGIGGVDGNGQVELAEVLARIRPFEGAYDFDGELGYVPQDRQVDGLALDLTIADNLALGALRDHALVRRGVMKTRAIHAWVERLIREYQIKVGSADDLARSLSGGNQQKVVVSRTLAHDLDLLVVVNPTRGLDFRATQFVHDSILLAADKGAGVVVFSTDLEELAALADRTLYMSGGRLSTEFLGGAA